MARLICSSILTLLIVVLPSPARAAGDFDGAPITAIESSDFTGADFERLKKSLGLAEGRPLDTSRLNAAVRVLFNEGRVQSLFVDADSDGRGVKIQLRGSLTRRLRKLVFRNVDGDIAADARRRFPVEEGAIADMRAFAGMRERIKALYEANGYNYAEVKTVITDVGENGEADVEISVEANQPTVVSRVSVAGGTPEENRAMMEVVTLRRGQRFSRAALNESLGNLQNFLRVNQYPTSKVEEAGLDFSENSLEVEVTFVVRLGERVQFHFVGNTAYPDIELRSVMTAEVLSQADAARRIAELVESKYRRAGYHFCRVIAKPVPNPADRLNLILLQIEEGPRVRVESVRFPSGQTAGDLSLTTLYFASAPGALGRGLYWEAGLRDASITMQSRLVTLGFMNARVSEAKPTFTADRRGVELFVDIDTGVRTFVTSIEFAGMENIPAERLGEELSIRVGEPLDRARVELSRKRILELYADEGYIDAKFAEDAETAVKLTKDRKAAAIRMDVIEGRRYVVGKVTLDGNRKTKPKVILREMRLEPGDPFSPKKLRQSEEDISVLGLFSRAEALPSDANGLPGTKDINVVVRETRPGVGEVGLGGRYEEPRLRLRSFMGLAYRNLFGLNQTASARTEISLPLSRNNLIPFVEYSAVLGYRAPYPFELPFAFATSVGLDSFEVSTIGPRILTRARVENRIERKFSNVLTAIYRLHRFERTQTEQRESTSTPYSLSLASIGSTGPGLILDLRDDPFNPTRGSLHSLEVELAHPALLAQDDIAFVMALMRNSFYVPLFHPFGLSFYVGVGYAHSLFGGKPVPEARLVNELALGGQLSIRGIAPRALYSPATSENTAYYNARAEFTTALFSGLSLAVFFDAGQIFPDFRPVTRADGFGLGFRYKTPVGPVVIDFAQGLGPLKEAVKFYFSVGTF